MGESLDFGEFDHGESVFLVEGVVVQVSHGPIGILRSVKLDEEISVGLNVIQVNQICA
jgi:hypothetical protein